MKLSMHDIIRQLCSGLSVFTQSWILSHWIFSKIIKFDIVLQTWRKCQSCNSCEYKDHPELIAPIPITVRCEAWEVLGSSSSSAGEICKMSSSCIKFRFIIRKTWENLDLDMELDNRSSDTGQPTLTCVRAVGRWETWCCPVSHCTAGGKLHVLRLQGSALLQHGLPEGAVAQPLQALQTLLVSTGPPVSAVKNFIK